MTTDDPTKPIQAKILVTVKTYPTPSVRHVETVCVAGVRLDTAVPEWVRLYPIPFRTEGFDYEFSKYQIIDVPITARGTRDPRPESYQPDNQRIRLGDKVDTRRKWTERRKLLGHLVGEKTTCELIAINRDARMNEPAPSLGLVKPRDVVLTVEDGKAWTSRQQAKADRAAEPTLFGGPDVKAKLEPMPYQIKIRYKCLDVACPGHRQTIIDWEVGSAAYWWRRRYPEAEIPGRLLDQWQKMMMGDKDTHLYIGNQHQHRRSFSVLGVWYPPKG